ncbi:MAG: hypothetical protein IJC76_06315 [Lachnospiraceae bacterium]|nr:hypothetical protein [Lachnospiraceae bacterium]
MHKFDKVVDRVFHKIKKIAKVEYIKGNYNEAIKAIIAGAYFMYYYAHKYSDRELEIILKNIAKKTIKVKNYEKVNKRIIFFDSLGLDNRDLTMTYIDALTKLGYNIVYVTINKNKKDYANISKLVKSSGGKIYTIMKKQSLQGIRELGKIINNEKPSIAFMHVTPDDVVGNAVFSAYEGKLERYMINLTDHTGWIGTSSFDYLIEFRSIGYVKSYRDRKINKNKLLLLPFYPYDSPQKEFGGFPFDSEGKKVIYSGGQLYKLDGSDKYFEMAKHILDNYKEAIILYTGYGNNNFEMKMRTWIVGNNYQKRFYFTPERKDVDEIMKNCYFYLNTYPVGGGLMTQYAIKNKKIPITLTDYKHHMMQLVIGYDSDDRFIFDKYSEAIKEIDRLMADEEYCNKKGEMISKRVISKSEFEKELYKLLNKHTTKYMSDIDEKDYFNYKKIASERSRNDYITLANAIGHNNSELRKYFPYIVLRRYVQKFKKWVIEKYTRRKNK